MAAKELNASKLVFLHNGETLVDTRHVNYKNNDRSKNNYIVHNLPLSVAIEYESRLKVELGEPGKRVRHSDLDPQYKQWKLQFLDYLQGSIEAAQNGVARVHMVSRHEIGGLITELCTRDGTGVSFFCLIHYYY